MLATPDGLYVLAGGRSGRVYMWEAASGSLLRTWDAHFKAVTCMAVSSDGGLLFTGSEDTLVKAWALGEVLSGAGEGDMDPAGMDGFVLCIVLVGGGGPRDVTYLCLIYPMRAKKI